MEPLSLRQYLILDVITAYAKANGYPPTVRYIADAVGLRSTSTVAWHLSEMERKGWIRRAPGTVRAIAVIPEEGEVSGL